MKGTISGIMMMLLLASMLTLAFNVEPAETEGKLLDDGNTKGAVSCAVESRYSLKSKMQGLPLECSVSSGLVKTISVETPLSDCSFHKVGIYDYVHIKGFETYTEPGKPQLPIKTFVVTLPKDSKVLQVEVTMREVIEIEGELYIVPTPQPLNWTERHDRSLPSEIEFEINESIYSLDTYFPNKAVSYDEGCDNENRQVFVRFSPIQYVPETKKAYLTTKAEICIRYQLEALNGSDPRYEMGSVENIVITPPSLFEQAETLKDFHNSEGLVSEVVNTTWIYDNYAEAPDPPYNGYSNLTLPGWGDITGYNYSLAKRIISFLNDSSEHLNLGFVTLFGNARLVPPSYYLYYDLSGGHGTYNDWIPADFFYGSPDYDLVANYKIGRIPLNNTEEAGHVVSKIASWNSSLSYDWFRNVVIGGGKPFGTIYYFGEMITTDSVNRDSFVGMNITKRFHTGGDFDPEHLIDALSGDTGMIYIITHGSGHGIYPDGQSLVVDDLLALPSCSRVPVVVSIACMDGAFDTNVLYGGFNTSFGQGVLLSNASGIAYIGGSRANYGVPYFYLDDGEVHITKEPYMAGMLTYVFEAYHNGALTLGGITKEAMEKYLTVNSMSYILDNFTLFEFCLLGDPALQLPPQQPGDTYVKPKMTAVEPEGYNFDDIPWYFNGTTITISSQTDSPNVTVRRLEVFDDQTVDLLDGNTVAGWFNYTFQADVGTYLARSASFCGKEGWIYLGVVPPLTGAQTLVVDDDQGGNYEEYYQDAISSCGYTSDTWPVYMRGSPTSFLLSQYSTVIWLTGDSSWDTLSFEDRESLEEYLDGGGCLFISGQDIGYDCYWGGWTTFYQNYLHANYIRDNTGTDTLEGVNGDPIGDGLNIGIAGGDGANNQWYPSEIEPADMYTSPVFSYTDDGYGTIKAQTGSHKVVYFSFGFEAINTTADRNTIMERILQWFETPHDIAVSLDAPFYLLPGDSCLLNITVFNHGVENESDVAVHLFVNDTMVMDEVIPSLVSGTSTTFSHSWTPSLGWYNITAYVQPVPGENMTNNNRSVRWVDVSTNPRHVGDIIVEDNDIFIIEDVYFTQTGNIIIQDNATFFIRNATLNLNQTSWDQYRIEIRNSATLRTQASFIISDYNFETTLLNHAEGHFNSTIYSDADEILPSWPIGSVYVKDDANISVYNSTLSSLYCQDSSVVSIYNSRSTIEYVDCYGSSVISIFDSELWTLRLSYWGSSNVTLQDSTVARVVLDFGDSSTASLTGLNLGLYSFWNIHINCTVTGIAYNLTLINTNITNGWELSCQDSSIITVYNSTLTYLDCYDSSSVSGFDSEIFSLYLSYYGSSDVILYDSNVGYTMVGFMGSSTASLSDLNLGPYSFWNIHINETVTDVYWNLTLVNTEVTGGWEVFCADDSAVSVSNSTLNSLFCADNSQISVHDSPTNYLYAFSFSGTLYFDNVTTAEYWSSYYSHYFVYGSVSFPEHVHVYMQNSIVTRNYNLQVFEAGGSPIQNASVNLFDSNGTLIWNGLTDGQGRADFNLTFTEGNYTTTLTLEAGRLGFYNSTVDISLLSDTPIQIYLNPLTTLSVNPAHTNVVVGAEFTVNVTIDYAEDLYAYELWLSFDNTQLNCTGIDYTGYLNEPTLELINVVDNDNGRVGLGVSSHYPASGKTGGGVLATVHFTCIAPGNSTLHLYDTYLSDSEAMQISHVTSDGDVANLLANLRVDNIVVVDYGCDIYVNDTYWDGSGYYVPVNVTVTNVVGAACSFNVSLTVYWIDGSLTEDIVEWRVSGLNPGENATLTYLWRPAYTGYYNLTAVADCDDEIAEINESDNALVLAVYHVTIQGDINSDCVVNIMDAVVVCLAWGATDADPQWNLCADLDHNGLINIMDAVRICINWGKTCP